jgi:acyl-CoA thioester hydrolase
VAPASFEFVIRVYFEDTDAGGVVFYANYLKFFERARTEWLRAIGFEQSQLTEDTGLMFAVRHTSVDYLRSARLDDALLVVSRIARLGGASVDFHQEAWRFTRTTEVAQQRELVATGRIKVACVRWERPPAGGNLHSRVLRPAAIPQSIKNALSAKP